MLSLTVALAALSAPPTRHEVTSLPGYDKQLPSKMFSGFVDAGVPPSGVGEMYFHYIMFEAENNPETAPTVFWYNGGPGASSLFGLFQELGPLFLNVDSEEGKQYNKTHIPKPIYNPFTWSKNFNLFALDSPAPVGFSYCTQDGPAGKGTSCGPWKDTDVFKANHKVLTTLMNDVFPELRKNELFITGESYAGIYVPGLVNALLDDMAGLNLKGYAVGDGCMGDDVGCKGPYYDVEFFGGHGQISNELFNKIRKDCPKEKLCSGNLSPSCHEMVHQDMTKEIGGYFVYDLYDDCPSNMISSIKSKHNAQSRTILSKYTSYGGAVNEYACSGTAMTDFLSRPDVRKALAVPENSYFFNADNGIGFNYTSDISDIRPIHVRAVKAGIRVLTYEGDADASGLNSEGFIQDAYVNLWKENGLNRTQTWRPWTTDGSKMVAGYAMEWHFPSGKGVAPISFISIRGSGHMVPLNKPKPASVMINSFVYNKDYPHYVK